LHYIKNRDILLSVVFIYYFIFLFPLLFAGLQLGSLLNREVAFSSKLTNL
jgi:hypothetical protein